ncbi:MAG: hypothetical protein QOG04_990 [Actinomycetota bacterium]|jgi:tetratricopeptide (TPR) repeat protein|nr:hypothetical protein [Actinomycetota bacterium]
MATLLLVVLFFARGIRDPFNVPKLSLLFIGTAAAATIRAAELLQGASRKGLDRFWIPSVAIAIPLAISWLLSPERDTSLFGQYGRFQGLIPYLVTIIFAFLIADAFDVSPNHLAWAVVGTGAFVGFYTLMQATGLDPFKWSLGAGQTFQGLSSTGNPNFTGGLLGMVMPLTFALWLTERKRYPKILPWCAVFITGGWIYAQSQGGWAAGIAGLAVMFGIVMADRIPFGRIGGWIVAGGVFAVSVGVAAIGNAFDLSWIPLTARLRGEWWVMATKMGVDHPIAGQGPDSFGTSGMAYRTLKESLLDRNVLPDTPHSVFLWFFACCGIIGAVGFLVLIGWVISRSRSISSSDVMAAAFLGGSVAYFTQAFVSIDQLPLRVMGWTLFGGLAATWSGQSEVVAAGKANRKASNGKKPSKKQRIAPAPLRAIPVLGVLILAFLAVMWWSTNFYLADARARGVSDAFAAGDYERGMELARKSIGFRYEPQYQMVYAILLGDAGVATEDIAYFEEAEAQLAFAEDSPDIRAHSNRGHIYELWSQFDQAKGELALADYQRTYEMDPYNPQTVINLSDMLVKLGRYSEAVEVMEPMITAVQNPPRGVVGEFPEVWGAWAMALASDGQVEKAKEALAQTIAIDEAEVHITYTRQILNGVFGEDL